MLRVSEAADIVELLAAGFASASRPTKVVLQRRLPQRRASNAVSVRIKEAADTAEIGCCSGLPAQADQQRSCCRRACQDRCCHCSATCCRRACQERCYADGAQQDAACCKCRV